MASLSSCPLIKKPLNRRILKELNVAVYQNSPMWRLNRYEKISYKTSSSHRENVKGVSLLVLFYMPPPAYEKTNKQRRTELSK
jgi:hypothetical protein